MAVDGLNVMPNDDLRFTNLHLLVRLLRHIAYIGIIVYEPVGPADEYLEYCVDVIIDLNTQQNVVGAEYLLHRLSIEKSRYQATALGWHQYKIRTEGIVVFPSVHFIVRIPGYMETELFDSKKSILIHNKKKTTQTQTSSDEKVYSIIETVLNNCTERSSGEKINIGTPPIRPGSITVILGPRGAFKSSLTMDFLASGSRIDQNSLLFSIIDNKGTLERDFHCQYVTSNQENNEKCRNCHEKLFLFHQRPGCIAPNEFFHYLKERMEYPETPIQRFAFWDLTQLEYRFPLLAEDPLFLPTLMDYCRPREVEDKGNGGRPFKKPVAAVIMGAANARLSRMAAATGDNVIFCWRDKIIAGDKNVLAIYVDRAEGNLGNEGKRLFSVTIESNRLKLPKTGKYNECLDKSLVEQLESNINRVEAVNHLIDAGPMIRSINAMQGLPGFEGDIKQVEDHQVPGTSYDNNT